MLGVVRVLVVEDEAVMARALTRGLTAEGFTVEVVRDGREGLWRAREGDFAAIVLDVMLPGLNGYKVCAEIRAAGIWTPVLMLTAKDGEYDEAEALDTGADDFLRKPFSFVVLVARLRALLRRYAPERPAALVCGDLVLDPGDGLCSRAGRPVALTPRERALLELLMRRQGLVVSKETALQQVWGLDFEGDPNVVEVYIGYLRRKVDRPFPDSRPLIETVRGLGYRMVGRPR
jgi:DNA-binding response OmpR family regulator